MLKNILIGIFAAILVVAIGTAAYNVISVQAAGGNNPVAVGQGGNGQGGGGQGRGQGGNGQANGSGVPQAQANLANAKTVHGTVSTYSYGTLTIQTDDGQSLGVQLGNSNYATTIGFVPQAGDKLTVFGFTGNEGLFSAITITAEGTGKVYTFRDTTTGRPAWAGGGKGQGTAQP
ncbi:MAG: hypothetical protein WCK35_17240 [Chloroflexota bacterium]